MGCPRLGEPGGTRAQLGETDLDTRQSDKVAIGDVLSVVIHATFYLLTSALHDGREVKNGGTLCLHGDALLRRNSCDEFCRRDIKTGIVYPLKPGRRDHNLRLLLRAFVRIQDAPDEARF